MSRYVKALWLVATLCAILGLAASPAGADYQPKGVFAGPGSGSGDGELSAPGRAAVEQSTGNLFVVDSGNDRVQVFAPEDSGKASYLTQFGGGELSEPWGIAIAEEGGETFVYVADAGNERIVKYVSDGEPTPAFSLDATFTSPTAGTGAGEVGDFHAALAIDPTSGDLLVADNANKLIQRFEADGTFVSSFDGSDGATAFEGPIDVAANSQGDIYVIDANGNIAEAQGTSKALRYSGSGEYKAELAPVGTHGRPATVAINPFNDEVVVSGDQDAVFEAGPPPFVPTLARFHSDNQALPAPSLDPAALYDSVSGLAIGTGAEDRLYVVLDVGRFFGTPYGSPQIQAFRQPHPAMPEVLHQGAAPYAGEATLTAKIATGNDATEYRFEWGATSSYGNETETQTASPNAEPTFVSTQVTGLAAATTYHYRVVATNSVGTVEGPDKTFTTPPAAVTENCPNAEIRERQGSTGLPECRAYEMVSPVDKNGNDVTGFYTVQASPDGSRVAFGSTGAFPGSESAPVIASYLSQRGGDGWSTRALSPPQLNTGEVLGGVARDFSRDLGRGVSFSKLALAPGAVAGEGNVYVEDNLDGSLDYVGGSSDREFFLSASNTGGGVVKGGSDDYSHVVLESAQKLTDDAPDGVTSVYEVTGGDIRLASILPGETPSGGNAGRAGQSGAESRLISADGKRIFFEAAGRLFVRIEGDHTVEVSASEAPVGEGVPSAQFGAASEDGSVAFFTANVRLTVGGEPNPPGFPPRRLYRYAGGQLQQIAVANPNAAARLEVLDVTPDGATAYFAIGDPSEPTSEGRRAKIYRWHLGDGVSEVATLEDLDEGAFDRAPVRLSASANGEFAAFQVLSLVTPDAQAGPTCSATLTANAQTLKGRCYGIYVYDAATEQVTCASCSPFGKAPIGHSSIGTMFNSLGAVDISGPPRTFSRYAARGISDDGTVYLDTPNRLTANDGDSKRDVYAWRDGTASLLTPGTVGDIVYADASADGSTVYAVTSDRLVAQDVDSNRDVYAVRVNGGFASQNPLPAPPPCAGETCQGGSEPAGASAPPGSLGFSGSGDVKGSGFRLPPRATIHGRRGTIRVSVPAAGQVVVSGRLLRSTRHRFRGKAAAGVRVSLTDAGTRRLAAQHRLSVGARVTFRPAGGGSQVKSVSLTFVSGKGR